MLCATSAILAILTTSNLASPLQDDGLTRFAARVRTTIAPIANGATPTPLATVDATAIRTAAIAWHHGSLAQRKLRILEWLGAVPSKRENAPVALPEPRARAAWFDSERSQVLVALTDGALAPGDEPEVFTTLAAADFLSLSTQPAGDDARRTRAAVAMALAQRVCWLELARFESGPRAALDATSAFSKPGAALERMAVGPPAHLTEPWFRASDEFTSIVARDFIDRAIGFGGSESLARVLRDPPRSSEQVLHPEKYFDPAQRDEPVPVIAFDFSEALGDDWAPYFQTELGEYEAGQLLRATGDPLRALKAQRGFGGDEFRVYEHGPTKTLLLHWTIVLDPRPKTGNAGESSSNAIEFIDSLRKLLERRYAGNDPHIQTTLDENAVALSSIEPTRGRYHAQAYRWQDRVEFLLCDGVALDLEHLLSDHP